MEHYDAIVLGVGGVGSATLDHLARRGIRALGIEQFELAHDRGSSHGQTRLIRQSYFEHPDYVPLVQRAFSGWRELAEIAGEPLYHEVGLVQIGRPDGEVLRGVRASAQAHQLPIENLSASEAEARFPGLRVPRDCEAVFETRAGYLLVERCVLAHARAAVQRGATLRTGETVRSWRAANQGTAGQGVIVETDRGQYAADRLVITAGPWASVLLADLNIPLEVRRKPLYWFRTRSDVYRADCGFPGFLYDLPGGCFYGFPQIDDSSIKVAEHSGGCVVSDPLTVDRGIDTDDQNRVAGFVENFLTDATTECVNHVACMYTMSPDEHFILDRHPRYPQVAFAAGLSGHGFKFAGVLGEELARLVCEGTVDPRAKFLAANRESLRRV
jgi:sarcosine oxidase